MRYRRKSIGLEAQLFNRSATTGVGSRIEVDRPGPHYPGPDMARVVSGMPQGSALFVCYINDMADTISSFIYMYADDTKMSRVVNVKSEWNSLQHDLRSLQEWSDK